MKDFGNIRFSGTFRDYQARVLQNANRHLADRRIHIVAAPGSGKTILGLELIRGLGKPAVVLSPSVIIRQQWGERFEGSFLPEGENADGYVSFDLKTPALITSVTYQALHAAMNRLQLDDRDEETGESENFTGFDLIKTMKEAGVKTVCLDEAHHLRSEWQKALESFLKKLGSDITLIALTATPPYDSKANEWKRYHDLCGDIDEEIFVPDLVAQKTLCPHQDYVIFNYPTQEELQMINERRAKAVAQAQAELKSGIFAQAVQESGILFKWANFEEEIYARPEEFASLLMAAAVSGVKLSARAQRLVADYSDRKLSSDDLERAMQLIIDRPDLFGRERAEELRGRLESRMMLDRGRVCIENNAAVEKAFISSVGKLDSIAQIARSEMNNLGKNLRMLILTDFIKKDLVSLIGSTEKLTTMGTVPIFEQVRRSCSADIALLSGTLVILPDKILPRIKEMAKSADVGFSSAPIEGVGYSRVNFQGSNKNKVSLITEAFNKGLFQILVGTKALLGEGWDSPCINSLILALEPDARQGYPHRQERPSEGFGYLPPRHPRPHRQRQTRRRGLGYRQPQVRLLHGACLQQPRYRERHRQARYHQAAVQRADRSSAQRTNARPRRRQGTHEKELGGILPRDSDAEARGQRHGRNRGRTRQARRRQPHHRYPHGCALRNTYTHRHGGALRAVLDKASARAYPRGYRNSRVHNAVQKGERRFKSARKLPHSLRRCARNAQKGRRYHLARREIRDFQRERKALRRSQGRYPARKTGLLPGSRRAALAYRQPEIRAHGRQQRSQQHGSPVGGRQ